MIYRELKTIVTPWRVMTNFKWIIFHIILKPRLLSLSQKSQKKRELADCQCKLMSTLIKAGNSGPLETPFEFPHLWRNPSKAFRKFTRPSENAKTRGCQLWQNERKYKADHRGIQGKDSQNETKTDRQDHWQFVGGIGSHKPVFNDIRETNQNFMSQRFDQNKLHISYI